MEEENVLELLQRYRRDRHILLNYILSGSLIKKVVLPPGAISLDDVDIDQVSVDYVLNCTKKGETLDLSEAIRLYHDSLDYPATSNIGPEKEFFLVTNPESSGSPPSRAPPSIPVATSSCIVSNVSQPESFEPPHDQELTVDDIDDFEDDEEEEEVDSLRNSRRQPSDVGDISPRLPLFATGITDDDLRETAYEILVASAGASGGLIVPSKEKKKEKKSKLMRKLRHSKNESIISESMDIRTRQGLLNALVGRVGKRMDHLLIPLELLCCVSKTEFSDKKAFLRWQKRQLNMLEEGLINHPVVGFGESGRKANEFRNLLKKIEESESLPPSAAELQRTECLRSVREIAMSLAERPARGDLTGEVCHWADGYPLNVRLYEKMLSSVFDILDEGKLTQEVEEILEFLKSTWRTLGITETIHDTCYAWVLFRQDFFILKVYVVLAMDLLSINCLTCVYFVKIKFIITGEQKLLQFLIHHLRRIPLKEQRGPQERLHLKSLCCSVESEDAWQNFTFFKSFLFPIQKWADKKLADYHLHFSEGPSMMSEIVTVSMLTRRILLEENEQGPSMMSEIVTVSMLTRRILLEENEQVTDSLDQDQIEIYISNSLKNAFARITHATDVKSDTAHEHVLASLAEETKRLLKKDSNMFAPILSQWHPKAAVFSASLLHKFYGNKLRPFLDCAEHLTEDVVSVFPVADSLEQYVMSVIASALGEDGLDDYCRKRLALYQGWEPISPQQRHGSSIVEVYRIIEETVDQFFALKVPMSVGELNSLCRGLDNTFQIYTQGVTEKLVNKEDLIPPEPVLTRYRKEIGIKAFVKKEVTEIRLIDEKKSYQINSLTTIKLCVRLNTLHYAITQLNKLEDSIQERWTRKKPENFVIRRSMNEKSISFKVNQKNAFDGSRKDINAAIDRICEFSGTKIIFWDLREPFIENLYKHNVPQARLEVLIDAFDVVLNQLCDVIVEPLRDRIVTGLLQASLDGLLRVILDGGPSRIFLTSDAKFIEDDLEILKEFFISGGDGLPRGTVENLVARVRPVITLLSYETRVLIDDLKDVSQGGRSKFGADSKTLLRILCHRSDSEASQFLKKQFKIPKSSS
ncbi:hypothetical protein C4D60_Mb02t00030 [Musa balbisiana]|uniref:MHD1 domain-containing protein n=1 Tax=Musa balbisiana TaxID=52838 RepID=A0A4S8I7E7_MUSBA|nr:hypothetical protein C4D60_Mb02t00030 [Musa balbisiana]